MLIRVIDPVANEEAIERIRTTFDEIVGSMDIAFEALNNGKTQNVCLPEDLVKPSILKPAEGAKVYGLTEDGIEAVAVYHSMGWALICRDGKIVYPDGLEEPEECLEDSDRYDHFYNQLDTFLRAIDMPDRILEPLDDEIDVEAGFGDADVDGDPLDPNDD